MKRLNLIFILLTPYFAQAEVLQNIQGYYKTKSSIEYTGKKLVQNKVEYIHLDNAIKNYPTSTTIPVVVSDLSSYPTEISSLASKFDYKDAVCTTTIDGAKIAFEADSTLTRCEFALSNIDKAMAKKSDGTLVFYQRYGSNENVAYLIEQIDSTGNNIESRFLFHDKGKIVGNLTKVERVSTEPDRFNVEHYSDYGDSDKSLNKVGLREYQWADNVSDALPTEVHTFSYVFGELAMINKSQAPYYWAIVDKVTLVGGKPIVESVKRYQKSLDGAQVVKDEYSKSDESMLLTYNFNNKNKLVGFSPDACLIQQIVNGNTQVDRYKGLFRRKDCLKPVDLTQFPKENYTSILNDSDVQVSVGSLKASAVSISQAIDALPSGATPSLTESQYSTMKSKFDIAVNNYGPKLISLDFWK